MICYLDFFDFLIFLICDFYYYIFFLKEGVRDFFEYFTPRNFQYPYNIVSLI